MLVNYFSPLAPVVLLLLSAFILAAVTPRLPESWRAHEAVRYALAPGLVVLAGLVLATTQIAAPQTLSAWNFGTVESEVGLTINIGPAALPFLLLTVIVLLAVMLLSLPLVTNGPRSWVLMLGAGAMLLFLSANQFTLAYTTLLFDLLLAYHWFHHKYTNLAIIRLFLGMLTAGVFMISPEVDGNLLLGLTLWVRLGLYPFFEISASEKQVQGYSFLAYWSFSLAGGMYLFTLTVGTFFPEILRWLVIVTMLLNGFLAWLFQANAAKCPALLTRLVFTQALLPFLLFILNPEINTAFTLGLTLSLVALWSTPWLGPVRSNGLIKFWPYLPALAATLTLIGFPLLLTWPMWTILAIFTPASFLTSPVHAGLVLLALILAMSGLARYWLKQWSEESGSGVQTQLPAAIAATIAAVPFLLPGLALLIVTTITQSTGLTANSGRIFLDLSIITMITGGAVGLGYFRTQVMRQFRISPAAWIDILDLRWLLIWLEKFLSRLSKFILRINVILEGQHYLGWALLTALVGSLIIVLTHGA